MTSRRALPALATVREAVARYLGVLAVFALSACSAEDRATPPHEVRELAGSPQAQQYRKKLEDQLRATVNAYAKDTPLTLSLLTINDVCAGGKARKLFFQDGDDRYKIRCDMRATAYFGAGPHRIGDVLDGILAGCDRAQKTPDPLDTIPFRHGPDGRSSLVDYYRGVGPNPNSPSTLEPSYLYADRQRLTWDTLRSSRKTLVADTVCRDDDPPVVRCLREPAGRTVDDIRKQHGMVFKLEISNIDYYIVSKKGTIIVPR
ncbi:hypothetical protein N4G70_27425 [Streptomyces sp. ASQP_92]|uniref:hypothetical protein n=1 Tax=Streptomyces sp. ASQP_92 TaxID=2979116 RepID=UPI0021C0FCF1|nr:hypothetical protein [Streptomyces sp. ASQP_92]MCT9092574.1 hypothetical protein [Streptomyces sp. ASQP_92]